MRRSGCSAFWQEFTAQVATALLGYYPTLVSVVHRQVIIVT